MATTNTQTLLNKIATQQTAQAQPKEEPKQDSKQDDIETADPIRIFHGEFGTFQQYLTATGKVVQFYKGYCKTTDEEIIAYCRTLKNVQDLTGKANPEDIPVMPKRERNRNWASAQGAQPHMITPAELLGRAVRVANTSNSVPAMQSTSTN